MEVRETEHLYLLQSKMSGRLREWVEAQTDWPALATSIALKWLDEGLRDRSITRDLDWGIPVVDADGNPRPGFDGKVYYVWFDAPIAYIGATQDWADATGGDWERWWKVGENDTTRYVQFMGKDNVAFHTLSFPTTIMGVNDADPDANWRLVDTLKAFNWVTWYGGKFSTSSKRGVFMDQAIDLAPSDAWRWHLMANAPESSDAAFTWEEFQAGVNSDLANVLGNFVNRITKYTASKFDGRVPDGGVSGGHEQWIIDEVSRRLPMMVHYFETREFRKALGEMRAIWASGNEYLTRSAPWTHYKTDPDQAAVGVRMGLNLAALFGIIAQPVIPRAAANILDALGVPEEHRSWNMDGWANGLPVGHAVAAPDVLFAKIEDSQVAEWTERFGGA